MGDEPFAWNMYGNSERFVVNTPVVPDGFVLSRDGHCGINIAEATVGGPPRAHLHVGWDPATLRSTFLLGGWEFESTDAGNPTELRIGGPANPPITFRGQTSLAVSAFLLDSNGSIGLGTNAPNTIGTETGNGRWLNLRAPGTDSNTGVAGLVVQGNLGSQMHLVHNNGPANQRIIRFQCSSGLASFHVLNDSLTTYAIPNVFNIKMNNGNIGLKVLNPSHPLHLASGAHCTAGGVWTNASSRTLKDDIKPISSDQARETVRALQPVGYHYKSEPDEEYVGFIAEDVPELVASTDRKSLAPMDIVAVLTKVVQDQERRHEEQERTIAQQQLRLSAEHERNDRQQAQLDALTKRLAELETKSE